MGRNVPRSSLRSSIAVGGVRFGDAKVGRGENIHHSGEFINGCTGRVYEIRVLCNMRMVICN